MYNVNPGCNEIRVKSTPLLEPATRSTETVKRLPTHSASSAKKTAWYLRPAPFAVICFLTLCAVAPTASERIYHDWVAQRTPAKPKLAIVGSSVIALPLFFMGHQATHEDFTFHSLTNPVERIPLLEETLKDTNNQFAPVVSMAATGQHIDGTESVVSEFLTASRAPETLLIAIAPIGMNCRNKTESEAVPIRLNRGLLSPAQLKKTVKNLLANIFAPLVKFQQKVQFFNQSVLSETYDLMQVPKPNGKQIWEQSLAEYKRTYTYFNKPQPEQIACLKKLLADCKSRATRVVIVNTPLHASNRELLPAGRYQLYRDELAAIANSSDAKLIDLGDSPLFQDSDFADPAHLNSQGGFKLLHEIAPALKQAAQANI